MTDKYLGGCKREKYVLIAQLAQYGSSMIDFHRLTPKIFNKVFTFKGNLFIAFIVKNINLGIRVEFFGMDEKLHSLTF